MARAFTFGAYNTAADWGSTLTAKELPAPEPKTCYVSLDGVSGTLDLTEALSGGPVYEDREVKASFVCSEGSYPERDALLGRIRAAVHGRRVRITEPDDTGHYFMGRVRLTDVREHAAYLEYTLEAVCDPWRYANAERTASVSPGGKAVSVSMPNGGLRAVIPAVTVTGAAVSLTVGGEEISLAVGTHRPDKLILMPGDNRVTVGGSGTAVFAYREGTI